MERILIVHTWGIGDWLFFTPTLKALHDRYPSAKIDVILGTPSTRKIVALYPAVTILGVSNVRRSPFGIFLHALRSRSTRYDALIFTAGINSRKADVLAMLVRAKRKFVLTTASRPLFIKNYRAYDYTAHRVENNLRFLEMMGIPPPSQLDVTLESPGTQTAMPDSVLIHPGSDGHNAFKRWPASRFSELSERLLERGKKISVILGPDEMDLSDDFEKLAYHPKFTLCRDLSFREMVELVSSHECLVNSDSGLGHIAAGLNRRVVTIFGPADPVQIRPYGRWVTVLQTTAHYDCMPCIRPGGLHGCPERPCLMDVDVDEVLQHIP